MVGVAGKGAGGKMKHDVSTKNELTLLHGWLERSRDAGVVVINNIYLGDFLNFCGAEGERGREGGGGGGVVKGVCSFDFFASRLSCM